MSIITATRYHDFSAGHRVLGHEGACRNLHGHNYRVTFTVESADLGNLDTVGRVLDFSVIKTLLCNWLEENWDHRFLVFDEDPWAVQLLRLDPTVVVVPFNPTAENMADWLLKVIGPRQLTHGPKDTGCYLKSVTVEETRKCSATAAVAELE